MQSPVTSPDRSTGYLEDAVADWADDQCKRRRVVVENVEDILQEFWNWNCDGDPLAVLNCPGTDPGNTIYGDPFDYPITFKETITTQEEEDPAIQQKPVPSSSKNSTTSMAGHDGKSNSSSKDTESPDERCSLGSLWFKEKEDNRNRKRRKEEVEVVYPFTVIKPGGVEGDVTLDDINRRILRRPTRPIRHPVGEFACLPCVPAANGPGLSGKAVVGLTRIHTQGRGTITIIRTRG